MNAAEAAHLEAAIEQARARRDCARAEELAGQYLREAGPPPPGGDPARSPAYRAAYLAAQVELSASRLGATLQHVKLLLQVTPQLPEELATRVHLLAAEVLARQQHHSEARRHLHQVSVRLLDQQPLLHLRALRIRLRLGELGRLTDELAACARALETLGGRANLTLLLCDEGRAHEAAGDLPRAEDRLHRAEQISRALGADPLRADVLLQMGRLEHLRGRLGPALDHFEEALRSGPSPSQALEVRLRVSLLRLEMGEWKQQQTALGRHLEGLSLERLPEELQPLLVMLRALVEDGQPTAASTELHAFRAGFRGETTTARELYRKAIAEAPTPTRQARLALALGTLAAASGDPAEAGRWLRQAETLARSLDLPEVLWRALQLRGELSEDEAEARGLLAEAVVLSEVQAGLFRHAVDAAAYRGQRGGLLRRLLRGACRRGDVPMTFRYQELERGRLLLELWLATPGQPPIDRRGLAELEEQMAACDRELASVCEGPDTTDRRRALLQQREELRLRREEHLTAFLRARSRRDTARVPAPPDLVKLQRALPRGTVYVAPVVAEDELALLVAGRDGRPEILRCVGPHARFWEAVAGLRGCLAGQMARYERGLPLERNHRQELDGWLDELGASPLGEALFSVLSASPSKPARMLWVPDGPLHGLPVYAFRSGGRYLIESWEVFSTFSGALATRQSQRWRRGRWRPALVIAESEQVLPEAVAEAKGVAAAFGWSRLLTGGRAGRAALRPWLRWAQAVHFACHAEFNTDRPLAACLLLPSGESVLAAEWLAEPVAGLPLAVLSACRSAEVAPLVGGEVFGLVTGLLAAGVRSVVAGLWPVADQETPPLMWRFYRHLLTNTPSGALAAAQREALAEPDGSPLFWAAFALFGDADALPSPPWWRRWLGRWRQQQHARCFPVPRPR